jgi:putative tryptophan/tyrosine transport system substrate-binding protein
MTAGHNALRGSGRGQLRAFDRLKRGSLPVVGWLHAQSPGAHRAFMSPFYQGLAEVGFVEGRNVAFEHRWAEKALDSIAKR